MSGFLISCARRRATSRPGRVALRLQEVRDVVEDHDVARHGRTGQARAAHQQRARERGHGQRGLLLPAGIPAPAEAVRHDLRERRERRYVASPFRQGYASEVRERLLQDDGGGEVGRAQAVVLVEREHARREVREDALEVGAAWSRSRGAPPRCGAAPRRAARVIALNDSVSTPSSSLDITGWRRVKSPCATARVPSASNPSGSEKRSERTTARPSALPQRDQQRHRQRERVQALQRIARERDLLVVAPPGLHLLHLLGEPARNRLDDLQDLERVEAVAAVDRHDHAQDHRVLALRDLRRGLLQPGAAQRLRGGRLRRRGERAGARHCDDRAGGREQRGLGRAGLLGGARQRGPRRRRAVRRSPRPSAPPARACRAAASRAPRGRR